MIPNLISDIDLNVSKLGKYLEFRNDRFELLHRQPIDDFQASLDKYPTAKPQYQSTHHIKELREKLARSSGADLSKLIQEVNELRDTLSRKRQDYYKQVLRTEVSEQELDPARSTILVSSKGVVIITTPYHDKDQPLTIRVINWAESNILAELGMKQSYFCCGVIGSGDDICIDGAQYRLSELKSAFILFDAVEPLSFKIAEDMNEIILINDRASSSDSLNFLYIKPKTSNALPEEYSYTPCYSYTSLNIYVIPGVGTFGFTYNQYDDTLLINPIANRSFQSVFKNRTGRYTLQAFHRFEQFSFFTVKLVDQQIYIAAADFRMMVGLHTTNHTFGSATELKAKLAAWIKSPNSITAIKLISPFSIPSYSYHCQHYLDNDEIVAIDPSLLGLKPNMKSLPRVYNGYPRTYYSFPKKIWQQVSIELPDDLREVEKLLLYAKRSEQRCRSNWW